ncbi:hypothetical protein EON63_20565, partial [archaeon]
MKCSLLLVVTILVIWVTGIIVLFSTLNLTDKNQLRGSRWSFIQSFHTTIFQAATLLPQQLPQLSDQYRKQHRGDDNRQKVYLMWLHADRDFGIHQYVALEGILKTYPKAVFNVLVVTNEDITKRKLPGVLAYTQFLKYRKMGYDIKVKAVGEKFALSRAPHP